MDKLQKQIDAIKKHKLDLDVKLQGLIDQRNAALLNIVQSISSSELDIYILVGGILDVVEKSKLSSQLTEEWRLAGQKFCRKHATKAQKIVKYSQKNNSNE